MEIKSIAALFIFILIVSFNCFCQTSKKKPFVMNGTDKYISASCDDSCLFVYKDYTVVTRRNINTNGDSIILVNNKTK